MRRILVFFLLSFPGIGGVYAISVSCSGISDAGDCNQCFYNTIATASTTSDIFVPRTNLTGSQREYIDLTKSTITGYAYQGANISPTGAMTSRFTLKDSGTSSTGSWVWADMKSGENIYQVTIPSSFNANQPVYGVKFVTTSYLKDNGSIVTGSETKHTECSFFYVKTATARCGNGTTEGIEECDDGNTNNSDSCSNSCTRPLCGNGTREGNEECDDNNTRNGDGCSSQCYLESGGTCGNGVRDGNEECDDGNNSNTDTCSTSCRLLVTNDRCRVRTLDSSGPAPLSTTLTCTGNPLGRAVIVITKNNTVQYRTENTSVGYSFRDPGRYTVRCFPDAVRDQTNMCTTIVNVDGICGNGVIESGENCDDGNRISGDSCDRNCKWSNSLCGNGYLDPGEQCDDGNSSSRDTCSTFCESQTPDTGPAGMLILVLAIAFLGAGSLVWIRSRIALHK